MWDIKFFFKTTYFALGNLKFTKSSSSSYLMKKAIPWKQAYLERGYTKKWEIKFLFLTLTEAISYFGHAENWKVE